MKLSGGRNNFKGERGRCCCPRQNGVWLHEKFAEITVLDVKFVVLSTATNIGPGVLGDVQKVITRGLGVQVFLVINYSSNSSF